jgi:hypothetical protein
VIYLLQAAAVAGAEFEAGIVAEAAELTPGQRLDSFDRAEESRLLRRVGDGVRDRYAFTHALVRDAIYGELLRGRRVRYHHKIAMATERAHPDAPDTSVNELAHHYFMGAALADADKAIRYCMAAGERALRLLAFEEAAGHFTRSLEVAEQYGPHDRAVRCDALIALAEAQHSAGETVQADVNSERAAALARAMGDSERLATAALRSGPLGDLGIGGANEHQVQLLEEARAKLDEGDSHLRAMVTARLGLITVYTTGVPALGLLERSLDLNSEAVAMARRLADRGGLGYALNARLHALWGIEPGPERLATASELGEIADDVGDEFLALHGYMWRVRELLARGDVDAVNDEVARYEARATGPIHPLGASYGYNVAAMMALIAGDIEAEERLGRTALEVAQHYNELAHGFYAALMVWTWWQRDELALLDTTLRDVIARSPMDSPSAHAAQALAQAEAGETEEALTRLHALGDMGWDNVGSRSESVTLALAAAACGGIGIRARDTALRVYEEMRPYAGTVVVIRPPAVACFGPADYYLGLLAMTTGDLALAQVHFEAALRLGFRMRSAPFIAATEVELARALRRRRRGDEGERVAVLLRNAEESALRMGLHRVARMAADPG